jgi:adenosine 3'-phospho 5'-phosphosulfate transporter B2
LIKLFVFGKLLTTPTDVEHTGDISSSEDDDQPKKKIVNGLHGIATKSQTTISRTRSSHWDPKNVIALLYCFVGLQVSFLVWGILQEKIMTTEYQVNPSIKPYLTSSSLHDDHHGEENMKRFKFRDSQFLVLVNRLLAFVTASTALSLQWIRKKNQPYKALSLSRQESVYLIAPLNKFSLCSVSNILSSWCQYEALKYVNFPTQVLSKACKLLPVMIMSTVISKKKYHRVEYFIAILVSLGMCLFLMGFDHSHDKNSAAPLSSYSLIDGLIILGLYLTFDSFTSNWQEKMSRQYQASSLQMMTFVNMFSILLTLTSLAQQSHLMPSLHLVLSSFELTRDCLLLSFCSAAGQLFIFHTISRFGAFTFTFIMTLRQTFAIILSCIIYGHSMTFLAVLGGSVVFTGLFAQIYLKSKKRRTRA